MNKNLYLFIMIVGIFSALLISTNAIYAQENITDTDMPKFFAIQHANSGTIVEINETAYSLELNDVSDKTILFSDRPDRIVMSTSTSNYIGNWTVGADSFEVDPPNAALIIDDQQEQNAVGVELFEPSYNYDSNVLVYNFKYLNNTVSKVLSEFGQTTLVIDATHPIHIH